MGQQIASGPDSTFKSLKTYGHTHTSYIMWQTEKIQGVEAVFLKSLQKWNSWKHAKRHHSFTICFSLIYGTFASTEHLFDSSGPVKVHNFQQHKALEPHILQDLVQFQLNDAFHIYIIVFSHEIVPQFLYYIGTPLLFHSGILGFSMVSLDQAVYQRLYNLYRAL